MLAKASANGSAGAKPRAAAETASADRRERASAGRAGRSRTGSVPIEVGPDDWEELSARKDVWEGSACEAQPLQERVSCVCTAHLPPLFANLCLRCSLLDLFS
jgi:hypothetical protein